MELRILVLLLSLGGVIAYKVYEEKYYRSFEFNELKEELKDYVEESNELREYVNELTHVYKDIKRDYYGIAEMQHNNKYNYKMSAKNTEQSQLIYDCSLGVLNNAKNQPFKYLCKYFNIVESEESINRFEGILNNFISVKEGKIALIKRFNKIENSCKNDLPFYIKFTSLRFKRELGLDEISMIKINFPTYIFRYISPGGNKTAMCKIELNIDMLSDFIAYLDSRAKYRSSVAGQRSLMTQNLRTMIKERDNHECQICGLSTRDEPNLLLEIDHIMPISKGGLSTEDNLQTLCWKCNRSKGSKIMIAN